jgi:hypothetical protein
MRVQKIAQKLGRLFSWILVWPFSGMFWNSISAARRNRYSGDFGEMEQHSSPQKDCAKVGEAVFANSWFGVFGGCLEYSLRTSKKTLFNNRI